MIAPFSSKASLKWFLEKFKEDKELDSLIEEYIQKILGHRIIMSPSKGPYGEKGKDIVAIENEDTGDYCSYVVKRGNLHENLKGSFGILRQIEWAMLIELEIDKYKGKKRTAVVTHNGKEGYRGAIDRFEKHCRNIEAQCGGAILLRPIERWDIDELANRIFEKREVFIKNSEIKLLIDRLEQSHNLILDFKEKYENVKNSHDPVTYKELSEDLYNKIKEREDILGPFDQHKI